MSHAFEADPNVRNFVTALKTASSMPKTEALPALIALAADPDFQPTVDQQSAALKQAVAMACSLKDYAQAGELAARVPIAAERNNAVMYLLHAQRQAARIIVRFGAEDFGQWPF